MTHENKMVEIALIVVINVLLVLACVVLMDRLLDIAVPVETKEHSVACGSKQQQ